MTSSGSDYAEGGGLPRSYGTVGTLGTSEGHLPPNLSHDEAWSLIFPFRRGGSTRLGNRIDQAIERFDLERCELESPPEYEREEDPSDWSAWPPLFHEWRWATRGWHDCELCQADGAPGTMENGKREIELGIGDYYLKTLDEQHVFAFPRMLGHYVRIHSYQPPTEFLMAFDHWFPVLNFRDKILHKSRSLLRYPIKLIKHDISDKG
jgi:hypothetical protein